MAAYNEHEGCVASLIQAGADIHKVVDDGCTPLSIAVNRKHEKIAALLRHFGGAR
jgi:ankyrin repeat protein